MQAPPRTYTYYLSCDLEKLHPQNAREPPAPLYVRLKLGSLLGEVHLPPAPSQPEGQRNGDAKLRELPSHPGVQPRPLAMRVEAQISACGQPMGISTSSCYADGSTTGCEWDEELSFCVKYNHLPAASQLVLTVWAIAEGEEEVAAGGTTMRLFSKKGRLKTGLQKLLVWEGEEGDCRWPTGTPGKQRLADRGDSGLIEHMLKRYERGELPRIDWLDRRTFAEIARTRKEEEEADAWRVVRTGRRPPLFLHILLPSFPHPVLYRQPAAALLPYEPLQPSLLGASARPLIHDPEVGKVNPCEHKTEKLRRGLSRMMASPHIKPNAQEKAKLARLLQLPPNRPLSSDDKELIYRFRYQVQSEKRALTKFLRSIDWTDLADTRMAIELMRNWAPIDVTDALELLTPEFTNLEVRAFAVEVLKRADDDELLCYLLQLGQVLRYEPEEGPAGMPPLAEFLLERAVLRLRLAVFLWWFLWVEGNASEADAGPENRSWIRRARGLLDALLKRMKQRNDLEFLAMSSQTSLRALLSHLCDQVKRCTSLSQRIARLRDDLTHSCSELSTSSYLFPFDSTEVLTRVLPQESTVFKSSQVPLLLAWEIQPYSLEREPQLPSSPVSVASSSGAQRQRGQCFYDASAPPAKARFIYKKGDDLRQDQFVMQMFALMDRLLKRHQLDLPILTYQVLPIGDREGLIQYVSGAKGLADIIQEYAYRRGSEHTSQNCIANYLRQTAGDPASPGGIQRRAVDNFAKSCAGYCVMTYVMGVGDRHNDNIMITRDGRLFHIDFGYILGDEPSGKKFLLSGAPIKVTRDMINFMKDECADAGAAYDKFWQCCRSAFVLLRRNAPLLLNLMQLMSSSSIPAIKRNPEGALLQVQQRLHLDLDEDAATEVIQKLMNDSQRHVGTAVVEGLHTMALAVKP